MGSSQLIPPLPEGFKLDIPPLPPGFTLDSEPQTFTGEASPEAMSAHKPQPGGWQGVGRDIGTMASEGLFGRKAMESYFTPEGFKREQFMRTPPLKVSSAVPEGHPVIKGVAEGVESLTTPEGGLMLAATGGIGAFARSAAAKALVSAGFSADMLGGVYNQSKEFRAASDAGDVEGAKRILGHMLVTGGMAGLTGLHAVKEGAKVTRGFREPFKGEPYDTQNVQGIPSEVGVREEFIQAQPIESPGREAAPAGGILQTQSKIGSLIAAIKDKYGSKPQQEMEPTNWDEVSRKTNQEIHAALRNALDDLESKRSEVVSKALESGLLSPKEETAVRLKYPDESITSLQKVPPLPEGFKLDVEVPSARSIRQPEPIPTGRGAVAPSDQGILQQPAQSELPLDPIRAEALDLANTLAEQFGGRGGIPTKTNELIFSEFDQRGIGTGAAKRNWVGQNINDIPVLQDIPHGKEAIENALAKRSGAIWDEIVAGSESAVRRWKEEDAALEAAKPKGESFEGDIDTPDISFNPAEFEAPQVTSIADVSRQMAKAGEQARGQAANEIIGQLGEKALGGPKQAGSLEGSPLFPKAEERSLFTGGPEAGSLPIFKDVEQMPLPKYAGSINLERVGADYPVKKLIRDVYDQYKGKIDEARRGVITLEETKKLADELGMTEKQLLKRRKGQAFNAEEVTATRDILNASARRLDLIKAQWAKSGSEDAVVEFRKAMDIHSEIQAQASGVATEAGRALGAHRIISEPAKGYKKMLDALGGRELNEEILKQFSQIDASDPRQVNAFVRAYSKATIWDQVYEAWRSMGLLSGPITHIVNTASNLLTLSTRIPETLIGAANEAVLAKLQHRPREAFFGEVPEEVFGALAGIKPGVKAALAAWNEEMPLSEARFEAHRRYIPGKLGKNIRISYRLLSAADEMLKSINYSAEAYQLAYRKARLSGAKSKEQIAQEIPGHLLDADIVKKSDKAAQYWTFNQPLGPWAQKVESLRKIIPGARYIIPFLRTSTNIAKFGLERTPLNFARIMRDYHRGNLKGVELSEELAKPILGSMIGAATVMLAAEGYITGAGPKNQNERETLLRSGWRPYSFKIGETYYPYGRLEPIGSVVGMAADFAEARGLEKPSQLAGKIAQSISKNLTSKTFMQGLASMNDAISDPERFGQKFLKSYAGTLVPNIVATVARSTDPYQRITEGPLQAIQSRIPIWSERLPPKRDVLGRAVEKQGQIPISRKSDEFIDNELVRVKAWIGDLDKKNMTTQQFDEYAQRVGKALRPRLEIILHSSLPDDIKREQAKRAASDARSQVRRLMAIPAKGK